MENKYFSLGTSDSSKLVKIFKIIFGILCFAVAVFWLNFNIRSKNFDFTLWISIIFLSGFGFYQIWSGLGLATRFILIGSDSILLKKNPVLPPAEIQSGEIEKIELYPLSLVFFLKSKKRILLRFGTTYQDTNEKIVDEIISFADSRQIPLEVIEEKL